MSQNKIKDSSNNDIDRNINVDILLERENQHNNNENWSKINRTMKITILNQYAERYCKKNKHSNSETKQLKRYLIEALDAKKITKIKDVVYNKDKKEITSIPGIIFNLSNRHFTIRNNDRASTLKSLTPRKSDKHSVKDKF